MFGGEVTNKDVRKIFYYQSNTVCQVAEPLNITLSAVFKVLKALSRKRIYVVVRVKSPGRPNI
jgi:hypothetical protein